ncbi:hypothetical protein STEG23_030598 [Scotinomys teguina]
MEFRDSALSEKILASKPHAKNSTWSLGGTPNTPCKDICGPSRNRGQGIKAEQIGTD